MLPKPKFDLTPRPTLVNASPAPPLGRTWFQYNPSQALNPQYVNTYPNYGQNYSNNNYQSFGNNFGASVGWHQNNYNSTNNLFVSNQSSVPKVWNQNFNQNYGKPQHNQRNEYQNKRFKDNDHKNFANNSNANKQTFNCGTCCRWFPTEELYNQHLSEHIMCGLDECKFRAHPKVIESHQRMQHFCFKDRSLVKKFMSLDTEEDIEKWREERKRNFPTKHNIRQKQELKEKQSLEVIEEKNRLKQIEDKQKQRNEKNFKDNQNNKFTDNKFAKNKKSSKGKGRTKPLNTFKQNRKLTLFQKLMTNEIQEENEEKLPKKLNN